VQYQLCVLQIIRERMDKSQEDEFVSDEQARERLKKWLVD